MYAHYLLSALVLGASASPLANLAPRQTPGKVISACTQSGVVALTFDDGPYMYTNDLLDKLADAGFKATFFLNGDNYASIYDYSTVVQRMIKDGHQVGSHTWSHADLTTLDDAGIRSQMTQLEDALKTIIGKFPTYMRPPYFSWNDAVLSTLGDLGYAVVYANIDTLDWENQDSIQTSVDQFTKGLDDGGSITLAHDVHPVTVDTLVPDMIQTLKDRGLKSVTVGECLGAPAANWYRTSR